MAWELQSEEGSPKCLMLADVERHVGLRTSASLRSAAEFDEWMLTVQNEREDRTLDAARSARGIPGAHEHGAERDFPSQQAHARSKRGVFVHSRSKTRSD